MDQRLVNKTSAAVDAMKAYFNKPGCTDPASSNYLESALTDDGSCNKVYDCYHIVQSIDKPLGATQ